MDLKREPVAKENGASQKAVNSRYIEEIKSEFRQITWTTKEELFAYTQIVVGASFVLGLVVYLVDLSIQTVLDTLTWLTRITIG